MPYDAAWLDWDGASPVSLSLPLREDAFVGDPVFAICAVFATTPRHFSETAARCGFAEEGIKAIFTDLLARGPAAITSVQAALPRNSPDDLVTSDVEHGLGLPDEA